MPRDTGLTPSGTATFGEWLRRELDRAGLSQTELARRMGASPGTISTWANGRRVPGAKSGPALAEALGVPPERVRAAAGRWRQAPESPRRLDEP